MKKITTYLYILAIAAISFFIVPIFTVLGSNNFLSDHKEVFENSHYDLISGTILAFRNNGTSALIEKSPLFTENYYIVDDNEREYSFDLSFYPIIEKKGKKYQSGLFVIIENINLDNSDIRNLLVMDEGRYLVKFEMYFDEPIEFKDRVVTESTDIFIPLYDGKSGVLFFDQSFLKNKNRFVEITRMKLSVETELGNEITLLNLYSDIYDGEIYEDKFLDVNRNISNITSTNINLLDRINIDDINNNDSIYHNKALLRTFRTKYNYFPIFIIVWILLVATLTYFIFVHKYVKIRIQNKKDLKNIEFDKLKDKIREEENKLWKKYFIVF